MATKNLVPRLDNEGKLGLKDTTPQRRWAEVNAVSGSFEEIRTDKLLNLQNQPLLAGGDNVTIEYIDGGSLGDQYRITSTAAGSQVDPDRIFEGDSSVEVVDTATEQFIKFTTNNVLRWKIDSSGHLVPEESSVLDVGSTAKKVRDVFLNRNLSFPNSALSENSKFRLSYTNAGVSNTLPVTKHVRVASTANVNLTNTSHVSLDGVTLTSGDNVLLKNQTTSSENGIYKFSSGQYIRSADFSTSHSFENVIVNVRQGTANSNSLYHSLVQASNGESSIGTNEQLWVQINNEGIEFTNLTEIGADLDDADLFIVDDGPTGVAKSLEASRIKKYIYSAISGDATVSDEGALTIASNVIDPSMLSVDHITFTAVGDDSTNIALGGTLNFAGTTNEIEVSQSAGTFTFGLPDNVEINGNLSAQNLSVQSIALTGQSGVLAMNNKKITSLGTPTAASDAATKSYVDSVAQGLSINNSVRVATDTSGTLASSFAAGESIDGITLAVGDRILLKDQTNAVENGIYVVTAGAPTRASDMSSGGQAGVFMFVEEGTNNADKGFVCISDSGSDVVGTNSLEFTTFSSAGQVTAGSGLSQTGSTFNVNVATNGGLEISSDELRVKAGSITDSMLAGSISASKIGPITSEDAVEIGALDFGNDQLASLTDNDKFIVEDDASNAIKTLLASKISSYVFGKVSGDATINETGVLTIEDDAIEASMLSSGIIADQPDLTTSHNNDLILVADSQNGNALKRITKSNFIQGATANIDFPSLSEITNAQASEFDELLINDKPTANTAGSNKKIKAKDLVRNSFLYTTQTLATSTETTIQPNTIVLLQNSELRYHINLDSATAKIGDIVKVRIAVQDGDFNTVINVLNLIVENISDNDAFTVDELKGSGLEFVFDGSVWQTSRRDIKYYKKFDDSVIDFYTNPGYKINQKYFALAFTGTKEIKLPGREKLVSLGFNSASNSVQRGLIELEFISLANQTITVSTYDQQGLEKTSDILTSYNKATGPSAILTTSTFTFTLKNNTRFKAIWGATSKNYWYIERIGSISLEDLTNVNWDPLNSASADNTILVSKTNSPGQIYGEKLTHEFIKTKDANNANTAGITRNVISDNAIGTSEIEDNKVTKSKLEKVNPYRILGVVDPNHPESSNVNDKETVNEVKVYTDFDIHATDVTNSNITEHNSLPTTQAVKNYVTNSISSLNITSSSQGANSYTLNDQNKSIQLVADDLFKTSEITIDSSVAYKNEYLGIFGSADSFQLLSPTNGNTHNYPQNTINKQVDPNNFFKIYFPEALLINVGAILQFNITITNDELNGILFLPHQSDPTIGKVGGTETSPTAATNTNPGNTPEAVYITRKLNSNPYFYNDYQMMRVTGSTAVTSSGSGLYAFELVPSSQNLTTKKRYHPGRNISTPSVTIANSYQWVGGKI